MNPEQPQLEHPEWEEHAEEISERVRMLRKRFPGTPGSEGFATREAIQQRIIEFARALQAKYPDYFNYRLYHAFIGGTSPEVCTNFDFPGEDSVELFVQKLVEEFGKRE